MKRTFSLSLPTIGTLLLCTAAYAQPYTVTFTLTCDKQASSILTPAEDQANSFSAAIHVADNSATPNIKDCGIVTLQCDGAKAATKTVQQECAGVGFLPTVFLTSYFADQPTLAVTNKHGSGSCIAAANGAVPSNNDCSGPGGGGKGATLSASSARQ